MKGRRLDALRAEVAQRRKAAVRRQRMSLLLWALAGAGALCLGWLVGRTFTPADEASAASEGVANNPSPVEASEAVRHVSADAVIADRKEAQPEQEHADVPSSDAPQKNAHPAPVTTLDELPEDAPEHAPEQKPAAAHPGEGEALTLDDLPLE